MVSPSLYFVCAFVFNFYCQSNISNVYFYIEMYNHSVRMSYYFLSYSTFLGWGKPLNCQNDGTSSKTKCRSWLEKGILISSKRKTVCKRENELLYSSQVRTHTNVNRNKINSLGVRLSPPPFNSSQLQPPYKDVSLVMWNNNMTWLGVPVIRECVKIAVFLIVLPRNSFLSYCVRDFAFQSLKIWSLQSWR